ncbi:glutamate--tRNA ligase [candidate division LCP-89 bacterium B3_LCP]|uniref:Glutamate--tRNA ligase n=1 Tax=candidate division LCP-89 bacterium B3_LCP TaxID=2012998 RepID=A0A532V1N5_UNCL8|nr:MAG: glutamate--tRNA ligase [candidate division LCP-89 bacterium B3_LCP]
MSKVRVRFAPSPTGYLHVGGARTALFNWLFARHHGGKMLLRIEDTDRVRSTPEAEKAIFDGLRWLGIDWDEEPLFQFQQREKHQMVVEELLSSGTAYRCFCDPEVLAQKQKELQKSGSKWGYPGTCRELTKDQVKDKLSAGDPFAVRFRTTEGVTQFDDIVHGSIEINNEEIDDFILLRRNGTPVYQVAVVADDSDMKITHVIRGDDHITNTPKQVLLYKALGLPVPQFAHVPLILGADKKRLSKRHGATSVTEYRDKGILAQTMVNFLALLGWSPGDDKEIMSIDELIEVFDLKGINVAGAIFDETKLEWMNGQYIASFSASELWDKIAPVTQSYCTENNLEMPERSLGLQLADLYGERLKYLNEAPEKMAFFLSDPATRDEKGVRKHWKEDTPEQMKRLLEELERTEEWFEEALEAAIDIVAEEFNVKRGKVIQPVRLALTGGTASPGIFAVMTLLGKETCLRRIGHAIRNIG